MKKKWFYYSHGKESHIKILRVMKLTILLMLFGFMTISAVTYSQEGKYSMTLKNAKIETVLSELQRCINKNLFYSLKDINNEITINIDVQNASLEEVLESCLKGTGLGYMIKHETIVLYKIDDSIQQPQKNVITGLVTNKEGESMPGVNVYTKDGSSGTITNSDGKFKLHISNDSKMLVLSFIGMKTKEVSIGKTTYFTIVLEEEVATLDDVIVTGVFVKPKESFTGAVTFITKEEMGEFKTNNLLTTISNIDPAFNIAENNEFGSDPNKLPEITIRGSSSLPLNMEDVQKNERVNLNTPLFILDGFEISLERMMDLDQEEIESVTILKDASSTALYGSRGANGVVVLTSVKPKDGKLRVSVSGGANLEIPDLRSYNLLNAREKLELERLSGLYTTDKGLSRQRELDIAYNNKLKAVEEGVDTYWLSKPLQTGVGSNARLSVSGGNQAFRYSISGSLNQIVGVMKGSYRNNFNGSANISYDMNKVMFVNVVSTGINTSQESEYGSFSTYTTLNPYWELYDRYDKPIKKFNDILLTHPINNPVYIGEIGGYNRNGYNSIRNTTSIKWRPNQNFEFNLRAGISTQVKESHAYTPASHPQFADMKDYMPQEEKGEYLFGTGRSTNWDISLTGNYAKVINKNRFFVGFDYNMRENQSVNYNFGVQGFTHEKLDFISMGAQYKDNSLRGSEAKGRSVGFTGTLNYSFDNIVYVDGSYRLDGASSFGAGSRFKPFYSVGLGWTLSRMNFFRENISFISNMRFRYNYGVTGTLQFSSPYEAMEVYGYASSWKYNGELAALLQGLANENLTWQMDYAHNLGLDLAVLDNRLSFTLNFYRKKTKGLTANIPLPLTNGFPNYTSNKGDVLNEGYDASVAYTILNDRARRIRWSVRASVANNRNELLKLSDEMKKASANAEKAGRDDPNYLYREGESMDALYVIPSLGIDPATGREIFIDVNGNPTYNWNHAKRRNYGLLKPKIDGRFSTTVSYKELSVTASFRVRYGGQAYNSTLMKKVEGADLTGNVDRRVLDQRWQNPGDNSSYIGLDAKYIGKQSSRFVQDDNSLQLSSLNINYRLPTKWLKAKTVLKSMSMTASIGDLFYISTVKRERGTAYPHSIKPRFTVSMTF